MSSSFPVLYAYVDLPPYEPQYPRARHKALLRDAERHAAYIYSAHGIYLAPVPSQAKFWIETCLLFGSKDVNRGRGERLSPTRGRLTVDCASLELPGPLARIAARSLVTHELGHIFGLDHCRKGSCVMTTPEIAGWADVIWGFLRHGTRFCRDCARDLDAVVSAEGT